MSLRIASFAAKNSIADGYRGPNEHALTYRTRTRAFAPVLPSIAGLESVALARSCPPIETNEVEANPFARASSNPDLSVLRVEYASLTFLLGASATFDRRLFLQVDGQIEFIHGSLGTTAECVLVFLLLSRHNKLPSPLLIRIVMAIRQRRKKAAGMRACMRVTFASRDVQRPLLAFEAPACASVILSRRRITSHPAFDERETY